MDNNINKTKAMSSPSSSPSSSLSDHLQRSLSARVGVTLGATVAVGTAAATHREHPAVLATCLAGLALMVLCVWTSSTSGRLHAGSGVAAAVLGSVVSLWSRDVISIALACAAWVCMVVWWSSPGWLGRGASAVAVETAGVGLGLASTVLAIARRAAI